MKKITAVLLFICILFCSCNEEKITEKTKISISEEYSEQNISVYPMNSIEYGKKSENSILLTKLEPLPQVSDINSESKKNSLSSYSSTTPIVLEENKLIIE